MFPPGATTAAHARLALAAILAASIGPAAAGAAASAAHPLTVQVTTSPKALAKLRSMGEMIKVSAFYEGPPIPSKRRLLREEGLIGIAPEEAALLPPQGGTVTLQALVTAQKWAWVTQHFYTINVTSARKVDRENNLLDCDLADGDLAAPPKTPIKLHCKLIYGE